MTPGEIVLASLTALPGLIALGIVIGKVGAHDRAIGQCVTRDMMRLELELIRGDLRHIEKLVTRVEEDSGRRARVD